LESRKEIAVRTPQEFDQVGLVVVIEIRSIDRLNTGISPDKSFRRLKGTITIA
jgi:hypothetical protein